MNDISFNNEILDSLAEGVFTVDNNFRIKFFNESAEKITGLKREEIIGDFCRNIFKSDLCSTECPIASVLERGKSVFDLESQMQNANGEIIPIRLNAAVIRNHSKEPQGGVVSFRNMSAFKEIRKYLEHQTHFYGIVGISKPMKEIFNLINEIAQTDATVLIYGETGTGKELIADAIHLTSNRKDKRFVKVNCSVLPPQLLACELFGHSKGAFTDAIKDRIGRFEYADGGTIFLDEVAEMPMQMQLQLLRVIQEGTFERIGESTTKKVNVRIIAATNVNLVESMNKGTFREDLFYRLNVIPIEVPPIRERKEDIPHLINHFIKKFSLLYRKELNEFDNKSMEMFYNHDWKGNVRELENTVEYAVIRSQSKGQICACNLPVNLKNNFICNEENNSRGTIQYSEIIKLLEKHKWNKSKVAQVLNIDRSTLWRKMKSMGIC